jgi:hypothetical protein
MRSKMSFDDVLLEYYNRKYGFKRPIGGFTNYGVWKPAKQEHDICCDSTIINTSKDSLRFYNHCCGLLHIANIMNVDYTKLIIYLKKLEQQHGVEIYSDWGNDL